MKNELVFTQRGEVYTSSKIVADKLGVVHKDLLRTIERIIERQNYSGLNSTLKFPQKFIEGTFTNKKGRTYKCYYMNEQAFMKLVMHLSGYAKAEIVQDQFIEAFSLMKQALLNKHNASWLEKRKQTKITRREETDVIKEFVEYATKQGSKNAKMYYQNITKMTNKALELLIQTKEGKPIRDLATVTELGFIQVVDHRAMLAIKDGMERQLPYKEIYRYAKDEVNKLVDALVFKRVEYNGS